MLEDRTYTEARVFSCVVSAYENNDGQLDKKRAVAVMKIVWPENTKLVDVPREIQGTSPNQNQNRLRRNDFNRLMKLIRGKTGHQHLGLLQQSGETEPVTNPPASTLGSSETGGDSSETPVASDLEQPPTGRVATTVSRIVRDTELAKRIKSLHRQLCQLCGQTVQLADGTGYAEGHHLQPLGKPHDGPDIAENIVCLCPNHHAACDLGAIRLAASDLRPAGGHKVGQQFIDYHNRVVYRGAK